MKTPEQREKARLRAERWRRAHGIGPRRPAARPWLALSISRSTYYRRRAKDRQNAALEATLARLDWQAKLLDFQLARARDGLAVIARELS